MTPTRPRLVLLKGMSAPPQDQLESLRSAFDVVEVENIDDLRTTVAGAPTELVVVTTDQLSEAARAAQPDGAAAILQHLGEGIGVVGSSGDLQWADRRLHACAEEVRKQFVDRCVQAAELFNHVPSAVGESSRRQSRRLSFSSGSSHYELVASPASFDRHDVVTAVVGVLLDVTSSRRLHAKIDAIDAAGSELVKIEASSIAELNMAERLKLLEQKIVHFANDLLNFDNFEIRLLDRETRQLELVIAVGLSPLKIGEVIYAEPEGNGISGYVATTGRSYICPDVRADPMYREGLDNAASSLTVPLRLHDQVIGVFNIESYTPNVFDEHDRQFAEIFGRYIAMATNILDLLVVERYTTNEQVTGNVLAELGEPLGDITARAVAMRAEAEAGSEQRAQLDDIVEAAAAIRRRIELCAAGPRTILGAEQEMNKQEVDPVMVGRRLLIADNEPAIRDTLYKLLTQRGCEVMICENGQETIAALEASAKTGRGFDLVLSDIKMPDRTGYEVFRKTKSIWPDTAVILMTGFGYDPHHSIVRASQEGLQSFLFKPFKATQLLEAISRAFTDGAP